MSKRAYELDTTSVPNAYTPNMQTLKFNNNAVSGLGYGWIASISAVILLAISIIIGVYTSNALYRENIKDARIRAQGISQVIQQFRSLYTTEVADRLALSDISVQHNYKDTHNAIPLPATLTRMLGDMLHKQDTRSDVRLFSEYPFPWQIDGGPQTEVEQAALDHLTNNPSEPFIQISKSDETRTLYYATADVLSASCVECHNLHPDTPKSDWAVGDIRGILGVTVDIDADILAEGNATTGIAKTLMLTTFLGGSAVAALLIAFIRYSRRENSELKQAMQSVENMKMALDEHSIVSTTDVNGTITYVNDKFVDISGYSREELLGQNHSLLRGDEHDDAHFKKLWCTINSCKVWVGEQQNIAKDGSTFWVVATIVPFTDEHNIVTSFVSIQTSITDRKRTEIELRELIEELNTAKKAADAAALSKGNFLANMSHEIRTPMTAILGFTELLSETVVSTENQEAIDTIQRNANHLMAIINDILDLSKIEASKTQVELKDFNPFELIDDVTSLVRVLAMSKGLSLDVEYPTELPATIKTDPTRLRQILINLIGNAIKFTEHGSVCLRVQSIRDSKTSRMQFDVIDTGIGLDSDQIKSLFMPFVQADESTTRKFGGTGLGLTLSKRFAQLLGGDIEIIDSKVGIGTTFRVTIPVGTAENVKMLTQPQSNQSTEQDRCTLIPSDRLAGLRILLAEDGPDNQRLITHMLSRAGAQVILADNGMVAVDLALEAHNNTPYDCILMDLQMPVMSGYEATAAIRAAGCTLPIIALTAHAMPGVREKCIEAGCDDYVNKPIDKTALIAIIAQYAQVVP